MGAVRVGPNELQSGNISCVFMLGSSAIASTLSVAVALTNLEDTENAKRAYEEAVRLDK